MRHGWAKSGTQAQPSTLLHHGNSSSAVSKLDVGGIEGEGVAFLLDSLQQQPGQPFYFHQPYKTIKHHRKAT